MAYVIAARGFSHLAHATGGRPLLRWQCPQVRQERKTDMSESANTPTVVLVHGGFADASFSACGLALPAPADALSGQPCRAGRTSPAPPKPLAEVLSGQPDRSVWHRAARQRPARIDRRRAGSGRSQGPQARRGRRGGAGSAAGGRSERSGETPPASAGGGRGLRARSDRGATSLLREAERLDPGPVERARITWIDVAVNTVVHIRPLGGTRPARSMIEIAEEAGRAGDRDLHIELLWLAALRASWFGMDHDTSMVLLEAVKRCSPDRRPAPVHHVRLR